VVQVIVLVNTLWNVLKKRRISLTTDIMTVWISIWTISIKKALGSSGKIPPEKKLRNSKNRLEKKLLQQQFDHHRKFLIAAHPSVVSIQQSQSILQKKAAATCQAALKAVASIQRFYQRGAHNTPSLRYTIIFCLTILPIPVYWFYWMKAAIIIRCCSDTTLYRSFYGFIWFIYHGIKAYAGAG